MRRNTLKTKKRTELRHPELWKEPPLMADGNVWAQNGVKFTAMNKTDGCKICTLFLLAWILHQFEAQASVTHLAKRPFMDANQAIRPRQDHEKGIRLFLIFTKLRH